MAAAKRQSGKATKQRAAGAVRGGSAPNSSAMSGRPRPPARSVYSPILLLRVVCDGEIRCCCLGQRRRGPPRAECRHANARWRRPLSALSLLSLSPVQLVGVEIEPRLLPAELRELLRVAVWCLLLMDGLAAAMGAAFACGTAAPACGTKEGSRRAHAYTNTYADAHTNRHTRTHKHKKQAHKTQTHAHASSPPVEVCRHAADGAERGDLHHVLALAAGAGAGVGRNEVGGCRVFVVVVVVVVMLFVSRLLRFKRRSGAMSAGGGALETEAFLLLAPHKHAQNSPPAIAPHPFSGSHPTPAA